MIDFSRRNDLSELMDSDETAYETFRDCLVDLARVNTLTFAAGPTLRFLDRIVASGQWPPGRPLTIVDAGSGYGDMLRKIDRWAARHTIAVDLTGVDLNPWSAQAAAAATPPGRPIRWVTANIFEFAPERPVDIVLSALFTHHLNDETLARFVSWMEKTARIGWFVNDLHRHPFPYHAFGWATRLLGFHHFVQHDGPISIARAFSKQDWRRTLAAAGIAPDAADVTWQFPFKLCVSRIKG